MKKLSKVIISALLITVVAIGLISCKDKSTKEEGNNSATTESTTYPLTIKDTNGAEVQIDKEPTKVVSLAPNVTETIFALGKGSELVGRTTYCDYPEEAKSVQDVGTLQNPNLETIAALKPDVVIASTHFQEETEKKLEELNIKVVVLYSEKDFDGVYKNIETLGQILNANPKAQEIVTGMKNKVQDVTDKVKGLDKPSMYYVVAFGNSDFTAGGDTFIGQVINMAGGKNIAEDVKGWNYNKEDLVKNNPSIVVVSKDFDSKNLFSTSDIYKNLDAVKNNKVLEMDTNKLDRQGPRLAEGLEDLAKLLHPDAFK